MQELSVQELAKLREDKVKHFILDVRDQHEYDTCNLGGKLIPLVELPQRLNELDPEALIIVHCKGGGRSSRACEFLSQSGFKNVQNLRGGISAWWKEIDPMMAKY